MGIPSTQSVRNIKCRFLVYRGIESVSRSLPLFAYINVVILSVLSHCENLSNIENNGVCNKAIHIEGIGVCYYINKGFYLKRFDLDFGVKQNCACVCFPSPTKRHWVYF